MSVNEAQIEKYLSGLMTAAEQEAFEASFQDDPLLEAELREYLLAKGSIFQAGLEAEKAKLDALFDEADSDVEPGSAGNHPFRPQLWLSIAAAVLLLMVAGYFFLGNKPQPEELFATYYEAPAAPEQMGAPGIDSLLQLAHGHFNQQNYPEAIQLYTQVTQLNGRAESWQYLAYSYLAQGKSQLAIEAFLNDTQPTDMSEWYLALAYLQAGNSDQARESLQAITSDPNHDFQQKAEELLSKLAD